MMHTYTTELQWSGSTGAGWRTYDRTHEAVASPAPPVRLTASPEFRGSPDLTNPEQLLVMAASSCQLLSFLAVAARHGVDVVAYEDTATGVMPQTEGPMSITRVDLAPRVTVAEGTDTDLVRSLVHQAHETCFIANSLRSEVVVSPTVLEVVRA